MGASVKSGAGGWVVGLMVPCTTHASRPQPDNDDHVVCKKTIAEIGYQIWFMLGTSLTNVPPAIEMSNIEWNKVGDS